MTFKEWWDSIRNTETMDIFWSPELYPVAKYVWNHREHEIQELEYKVFESEIEIENLRRINELP